MSNERDMTRAEKKRLTSIRKEFAELKGAGCIPVLTSFEEYLKTFPDPAIIQTKLGKNQDPTKIILIFKYIKK